MDLTEKEEVRLRTRANLGRSYLSFPAFFLSVIGAAVSLFAPVFREPDKAVYGMYAIGASLAVYLLGEVVNFRRARARAIVQMLDRERAFSSSMTPLE
jgi:hypothetical protein